MSDVDVLIVGGGITGLAAAHRLTSTGTRWLLVDRAPRLGGKIATERVDGYVIEGGPDCFLGAKPGGVALCRALGIDDRLTGTSPAFRRTYVRREDRLHELPAGITGLVPSRLGPLMTTPILSWRGRVRAALELFVRRRTGGEEESIADFVTRRFGAETYDWLVEPLLAGIYAGDGRALSLPATFPRLVDLEREHGSVIRRMLTGAGGNRGTNGTPPVGFLTLQAGLGSLVEAIEQRVPPEAVRVGTAVTSLRPVSPGFEATCEDGTVVHAGAIILAVPAYVAAELVGTFAPGLAEPLRAVPFVSTATVSVVLPASAVPRPLDGYGYVSPRAAGGPVVASTWTSNKFPHRVPNDDVLIRFFLGRSGNEELVGAPDEEIRETVRGELARMHDITAEPTLWRIFRWPRGLPQYTIGHPERLRRIETESEAFPNLALAGASYRGVGIPDCIESGWAAAGKIHAAVEGRRG